MVALEQAYPREKGFWYLDGNAGSFGLWVNGYGGHLFTPEEIESGVLAQDIVTPSRTYSRGNPLPTSGVIYGPQKGGLMYGVNGFFANFGISGWRVSYGDRFSWGPDNSTGYAAPQAGTGRHGARKAARRGIFRWTSRRTRW